MGIVESWTNFERHNGGISGARERFEVFCAELLDLENPDLEVHQIAANPGDDGIDVLVPDMIPIYVELNKCPSAIGHWRLPKYGNTNYITRYVKSIMDDGKFESYLPEQLWDIEKEFMKETESPQYLLLLDGFNEINTMQADGAESGQSVRELLRNEIEQFTNFTNVRIILTTRRMSENYLPNGFNYIVLQGQGWEI